jgi:hypothetical protein
LRHIGSWPDAQNHCGLVLSSEPPPVRIAARQATDE